MNTYSSWLFANPTTMGIVDSYTEALKAFGKLSAPASVLGLTRGGMWIEVRRKVDFSEEMGLAFIEFIKDFSNEETNSTTM